MEPRCWNKCDLFVSPFQNCFISLCSL